MLKSMHCYVSGLKFICFAVITICLPACGGGGNSDDTESFVLKSFSPDEGMGSASIDSDIVATFSQAVDEKSITPSTFWVKDEQLNEKVKGKYDFSEDKKTVTFKPNALFFDRSYQVNLYHGITNSTNTHLESDTKIWNFFTQEKPPVFMQFPAHDATSVNTNVVIRVEFEADILPATLNDTSFTLNDGANLIPAQVKLEGRSGSLTPLQPLQLNTTYNVAFSSSILNADNTITFPESFPWTFQTRERPSSTLQIGTAKTDAILSHGVDAAGSVYAVGRTEGSFDGFVNNGEVDGFIAKYSSTGALEWLIQQGSAQYDTLTNLSIGSDNNLYVSGSNDEQGSFIIDPDKIQSDILVNSYTDTGADRWSATFGASDGHDLISGQVMDESNNLYVVGATMGALSGENNKGGHDAIIAKYDTNGTQLWQKQFGTDGDDAPLAPFYLNNKIYVPMLINTVLEFVGPPPPIPPPSLFEPNQNLKVIILDQATGLETGEITVAAENFDFFTGVTIDLQSNIYVTGMGFPPPSMNAPMNGPTIIINKYDSNGILLWSKPWPENLNGDSEAITMDSMGNAYVGAFHFDENFIFGPPTSNTQPVNHVMLLKLDTNGNKVWMGKANIEEHANITNISITPNGDLVTSGYAHGGIDGNTGIGRGDGFILKFNANGELH